MERVSEIPRSVVSAWVVLSSRSRCARVRGRAIAASGGCFAVSMRTCICLAPRLAFRRSGVTRPSLHRRSESSREKSRSGRPVCFHANKNASAERALTPSRVACEARDGCDGGEATTTGRYGGSSVRFVSLCRTPAARGLYGKLRNSRRDGRKTRVCEREPLLQETKRAEPRNSPTGGP